MGAILAALVYKFLESSNKNVKPVAEKTATAVKTVTPAKASSSKNNSNKKKKK